MARLKLGVTLLVIVGMVGVVAVLKKASFSDNGRVMPVISARAYGNPRAAVKIIEFADFQCPPCAKGAEIIHQLKSKSKDGYYLEFKHFPLTMHRHARRASLMAECSVQQGKFWPIYDLLFNSQKEWSGLDNPDDYFLGLARGQGMDDIRLMQCMMRPSVKMAVEEDIKQGLNMGVKSTPTFFINGKMYVGVVEFEKALGELKL